MMFFSRAKMALIIGICALGLLLSIPNLITAPAAWLPWRHVRLGLDLKGGSYLLLQVDMASVIHEQLTNTLDSVRTTLLKNGTGYHSLAVDRVHERVLVTPRTAADQTAVTASLRKMVAGQVAPGGTPELGVSELPNGQVAVTLSTEALTQRANSAMQQSIEIVRRRIDGTGVVDPEIARQGSNQIMVQLPGISDPNRIKSLLGRTAHLTFHLIDQTANPAAGGPPPPGDEYLPMQDQPNVKVAVRQFTAVDGANLTDAQAGQDPQSGQWVVNFTFDSVGAREFGDITRQNVGRPFAIVLDNQVISAPVIREPILGGRGQISGNFSAQSATDLALLLRAGALPAPLNVVEQQTVGPELGADAIRAGTISLAVGFALVIGFMGLFYGLFGWLADIALVMNLIILMAILSLLQATLTLPGMAGILLTLGMAVDANILINERIREETRLGQRPLAAMETGFKRAYGTIIDSNATTLLAHVMLFVFGSGPVRGFAITICLGIISTLFTATLVARLLMSRWYVSIRPAALPV
ncbi:MAG: protein translocase subunit SecD [Acetobacteraceae bacterium]